jgi:hypothetical protein
MRFEKSLMLILFALISIGFVHAASVNLGNCYSSDYNTVVIDFGDGYGNVNATSDLNIVNNCTGGTSISFLQPVNLDYFGSITPGEVVITPTSVYVNSAARPDLDVPATITFKNINFIEDPAVLRDGVVCVNCTNITFDVNTRTLSVNVPGFSNYTLAGRQDFRLHSDPQPELDKKVYQVLDLGDSNRATEFKCSTQIYAVNDQNQWVLVETNPTRAVQATLFGNPDANQPESLGYFKSENGIANVYFDGASVMMTGYHDYEYVAQCANSTSKLVYEEPISTRYHPVGRNAPGRGIWFVNNGFYIVIYVIAGIIIIWILIMVAKGMRNNWRK